MRVAKILSIAVVSIASLIVIATAVIVVRAFAPSRTDNQQNFPPAGGQKAVSPAGDIVIFSRANGNSSFLYRKDSTSGKDVRLTSASEGIESEASFSHDGKLVVYSFAKSADSKSGVWVVGVDGRSPHMVTGDDEDALHPAFSPDDSRVFYAASSFTGNHSPIVRPARHDWDVFSIPVQPDGKIAGASSTPVTHASFYDLQSLDVAADGVNPGGTKLLISTSGYPIGALLEEFIVGAKGRDKIFQPHVQGESSTGPSYGEARFIHDGMDILFLAATDTLGGNYDYNVYSMSDVTGSEIKQLTHLKGMTTDLNVLPDRRVSFVNGGVIHVLDMSTLVVKTL
jgi:hypothetical protein